MEKSKQKIYINDVVEIGFISPNFETVGGSVSISLCCIAPYKKGEFIQLSKIIDDFDHCLISSNRSIAQYSERVMIIEDEQLDFLHSVAKLIKDQLVALPYQIVKSVELKDRRSRIKIPIL